MIPKKERLINQLLATIYISKENQTEYRIQFDNVLKILTANDYVIINRQYEDMVEDILNKKLVGMPIHQATKYAIACILLDVAERMSVSKEAIAKYELLKANDVKGVTENQHG